MNPRQNDLISNEKLMIMLSVSERTLRRWRQKGIGPQFIKIANRQIFYRLKDVDDWLDRHRTTYNQEINRG